MKKIRCPKCDDFVLFDEASVSVGSVAVFHCEHCGHSFRVRFKAKEKADENAPDYGSLIILENMFCHRQEFPLHLGDNVAERKGCLVFSIKDCNSNTGTFVQNVEVTKKEQRVLNAGDVVSLGATTMIVRIPGEDRPG